VVASETTFGRKHAPDASSPRETPGPRQLSPQAEAFRASLKAAPISVEEDFSEWRKAQRSRRLMTWIVALALTSPGLLCFLLQAPLSVSIALEIAGMAANAWLRHERRKHLRAISAWEAPKSDWD
jgi:hypothetical protein